MNRTPTIGKRDDALISGCLVGGCLLYAIYILAFLGFWALVIFALIKYLGS